MDFSGAQTRAPKRLQWRQSICPNSMEDGSSSHIEEIDMTFRAKGGALLSQWVALCWIKESTASSSKWRVSSKIALTGSKFTKELTTKKTVGEWIFQSAPLVFRFLEIWKSWWRIMRLMPSLGLVSAFPFLAQWKSSGSHQGIPRWHRKWRTKSLEKWWRLVSTCHPSLSMTRRDAVEARKRISLGWLLTKSRNREALVKKMETEPKTNDDLARDATRIKILSFSK